MRILYTKNILNLFYRSIKRISFRCYSVGLEINLYILSLKTVANGPDRSFASVPLWRRPFIYRRKPSQIAVQCNMQCVQLKAEFCTSGDVEWWNNRTENEILPKMLEILWHVGQRFTQLSHSCDRPRLTRNKVNYSDSWPASRLKSLKFALECFELWFTSEAPFLRDDAQWYWLSRS